MNHQYRVKPSSEVGCYEVISEDGSVVATARHKSNAELIAKTATETSDPECRDRILASLRNLADHF